MTDQDDDLRNQMNERRRLAALYRDIFEVDKRGQQLFDDLYGRFARHAKVHTTGGIDAVLKTFSESARREVIEYIVTMVNLGNGVDDTQEGEGNG